MLFSLLDRLARMLLFGALMMALGWVGRPIVSRWPLAVVALYVLGWVGSYSAYFVSHEV